ncbi:MAG TPA: dihydroorotate dehydrogenase electron transfer subunit [Chitinispirillaceae bacterium]|nr:dihydroorotate dehydrogenase electron transfer subunit [Chitinispirillaceae bacterium]
MKQFSAKILKNVPVADNFFELTLLADEPVSQPLPGQFLTLRVTSSTTPLLRRPFAYSGTDDNSSSFSIIYQKRGNATDILAGKQVNEHIDCIGPLGNNFQLSENSQTAILVAGGIGIGPILFLASELKKKNLPFQFIFGCRSRQFIPDLNVFSQLNPIICTDDGSCGFKGTTADYLNKNDSLIPSNSVFYTCGPDRMLHACHQFSKKKGAKCWVSVEQVMACGVGACMGCVVKVNTEQKYLRACKEGPVFDADILAWEDSSK